MTSRAADPDLRRSAIEAARDVQGVTVETYFAHFAEGEPKRVVFDQCDEMRRWVPQELLTVEEMEKSFLLVFSTLSTVKGSCDSCF